MRQPSGTGAFYDPGIGTLPPGSGWLASLWTRFYNLVSQALGLGLTGNIIDCYAAIVRLWRPGDRIFLFGFSRGAYTIRCLAATLCKCGIPTQMKDGSPLLHDEASSKKIAREAVRKVYQHTSSWEKAKASKRQLELLEQREAIAKRFREQYGSTNGEEPNVYPYFVGVFDTVASLSNPIALVGLIAFAPVVTALLSLLIWWGLSYFFEIATSWWLWFAALIVAVGVIGYLANFLTRIPVAFDLPGYPWYKTLHLTETRMIFYDRTLNKNVNFARHALSIDEARESFQRVQWGEPGIWKSSEPQWFEQLWFPGNHSDIGGSYKENESRLSDVSLKWILDAAIAVGLKYDPSFLRLYPDPTGPQHDETRSSVFKYAKKSIRPLRNDYPLHPSVLERLQAGKVLNYDRYEDYRPENLRDHNEAKNFYPQKVEPWGTASTPKQGG
ncbi:phospholipase effector Tle1 domain-containing protein [Bradyrhizobium sp. SRL28]|uniref:phospholipase effector Tle1 domain-containing protein n=1 Tax=Bradyrhizobium sp. SRL28 TaxID=2836178 RepID=UPI0027E1DCD8|nr:DUF2235 domain-containing protein [Bradyrhizobium sp. SRL28]